MVAITQGGRGELRAEAVGDAIVRNYQAYAADEGVVDELFDCLRRNMKAKKSQRIESADREAGYSYETVDDGMTQVASARALAQILRLMPSGGASVTVNAGGTAGAEAIDVTASERLNELEAAGGSREPIIAAVKGLLATLEGAQATAQGASKGGAKG